MSIEVDSSVIKLTRTILSEVLNEKAATPFGPTKPSFEGEPLVGGITLANYQTRTPNDEGTHVVVVEHEERIELIPQPPTPEELAAKRHERLLRLKIAAIGVGGLLVTVAGSAVFAARKPQVTYLPRPTMSDVETEGS